MDQKKDIRCHCDGTAREDGHGHESSVDHSGVRHDEVHSRETWSDDGASGPDVGDPGLSKAAIHKENQWISS